ncbi:MAG: hypothetical protein R2766_13115 [Saprospiraceae bacterium]
MKRLDISSVYPVGLLLNTISHIIAVTSADSFIIRNYLLLYIPENLFIGLAIFHIGSVVIMETLRFRVKAQRFTPVEIWNLLRYRWTEIFIISLVLFFVTNFTSLGSLGSLGSILSLLSLGSVLYLSVYAHFYNDSTRINLLILYVIFLSVWAMRYSYLRYEIMLPWISYFLGEAIARKSFAKFCSQSKLIIVVLLITVPPLFTYLGQNRTEISGRSDKLTLIIRGVQKSGDLEKGQTIMSRLSYINQLTHVVRLTRENGFYNGETLKYFSYAFVPRFLWVAKPTIQQGQWFALETGLALKLKSGKANNSINMTVPGELYLNFGWPGVIIGCWLFGLFIAFIWQSIQGNNFPSWGLQFYLLFGSLAGLGADLQVIVTLLAYFLLYKSFVLLTSLGRKQLV